MSLIQIPFIRKQYAGIDNPAWIGDFVAANQAVNDLIAAITGLGNPGFAILSGLQYVTGVGAGNTYTAGLFYLNGSIYWMPASFSEGLYLAPSPTDTMPEAFNDGNTRNIYTLLSAVTSNVATSNTPMFSGSMNAFRIDLNTLSTNLQAASAIVAELGTAAFKNVGTTSGTIAAGDASYSKADSDTAYALKTNVLQKGNITAFTPALDYDPSTKKYVDDTGAKRLASGTKVIGNLPSGGELFTVSLGLTLADNNYMVVLQMISGEATATNDAVYPPVIRAKTTTSFDMYVFDNGADNNINIDWIIFHF